MNYDNTENAFTNTKANTNPRPVATPYHCIYIIMNSLDSMTTVTKSQYFNQGHWQDDNEVCSRRPSGLYLLSIITLRTLDFIRNMTGFQIIFWSPKTQSLICVLCTFIHCYKVNNKNENKLNQTKTFQKAWLMTNNCGHVWYSPASVIQCDSLL